MKISFSSWISLTRKSTALLAIRFVTSASRPLLCYHNHFVLSTCFFKFLLSSCCNVSQVTFIYTTLFCTSCQLLISSLVDLYLFKVCSCRTFFDWNVSLSSFLFSVNAFSFIHCSFFTSFMKSLRFKIFFHSRYKDTFLFIFILQYCIFIDSLNRKIIVL